MHELSQEVNDTRVIERLDNFYPLTSDVCLTLTQCIWTDMSACVRQIQET